MAQTIEEHFNRKFALIGELNSVQIYELQKVFIILCVQKNPPIWQMKHLDKHKRGKQNAIWNKITNDLNSKFPSDKMNGDYFLYLHLLFLNYYYFSAIFLTKLITTQVWWNHIGGFYLRAFGTSSRGNLKMGHNGSCKNRVLTTTHVLFADENLNNVPYYLLSPRHQHLRFIVHIKTCSHGIISL